MLEGYNKEYGCLTSSDILIKTIYDGEEWIINHESVEFNTNGHIHASTLNNGVKQLVDYYLEQMIWKIEDEKK